MTGHGLIDAAGETEAKLGAIFAEAFGRTDLKAEDDFFALGGDSMLAVGLLMRVQEVFGRDLPIDILLEHPSVRALARHLDEAREDAPTLDVVVIQPGAPGVSPLFCLPGLGGAVLEFQHLRQFLPAELPILALPTLGAADEAAAHDTIEGLADFAVRRMRARQPHGPYRIAGYSLGGVVAFEAARQLRAAGEDVALLALLDSRLWAPTPALPLMERVKLHGRLLSHLPPRGRVKYVLDRLAILARRLGRGDLKRREEDFLVGLELSAASRAVAETHWNAWRDYRPGMIDRPIVLFRAAADHADPAAYGTLGWDAHTSAEVIVHDVAATHLALPQSADLAQLAHYLAAPRTRAIPLEATPLGAPEPAAERLTRSA